LLKKRGEEQKGKEEGNDNKSIEQESGIKNQESGNTKQPNQAKKESNENKESSQRDRREKTP
jgi:hypothetical protein